MEEIESQDHMICSVYLIKIAEFLKLVMKFGRM
jgi:hypothetical protein